MKILLTINGHGTRFLREGISTPKFLLEWRGETILDHILKSISGNATELYVGLNHRYREYITHIEQIISKYSFAHHKIIWMNDTNGQAISVQQLAQKVKLAPQEAFWIMNCDTILDEPRQTTGSQIAVEVFETNNPALSFIDQLDRISIIVEKNAISNLGSTGNYFFPSLECYNKGFEVSRKSHQSELYVSEVIQNCIKLGYNARGLLVDPKVVHLLGTPEDYQKALKND